MIRKIVCGGLLLVLLLFGMSLAFQHPLLLPLQIGHDEGFNNDLPWLRGFHEPELRNDTGERYRWMQPTASIVLPPWPNRSSVFELTQHNGAPVEVRLGSWALSGLQVGRSIYVYVPATEQLTIQLATTEPFAAASNDPRELGAALQGGSIRTSRGWALPPWQPLAALGGMLIGLLGLVWLLGGSLLEGMLAGSVIALGGVMAAWFAPLRLVYASGAIGLMTVYGLIFAFISIGIRWRFKLFAAIPQHHWRWLLVLTTFVFAFKLGGRLVPFSMPGDIGFHRNRVLAMLIGDVFRPAQHRGVATPYPSVVYALIQPLTLSGISIEWLLQGVAALAEALAVPIIWWLVDRVTGERRAALFAAIIYGIYPAGFMNMAWSFDSHILTQWAIVGWCSALVLFWGRWHERPIWIGLTTGLTIILIGHFGFYINMSLFTGVLTLFMLWRYRQQGIALLLAVIVAQLLAWLLYYSAFWDMFMGQVQDLFEGGASNLNKREPLPRSKLLWDTVYLGFWYHFALLPLLIAPFGWRKIWKDQASRPLAIVIGAVWLVSGVLGLLPLITAVPLTTRWLMFSAWGIAVTTGVALDHLWRNRGGKFVGLVVSGFVAGFGVWVWLAAVVYRIRPPEPF